MTHTNQFGTTSPTAARNNVVYVESLGAFDENGSPTSMTIPTGKEFIATQLVDLEPSTLDLGLNSRTTMSALNPTSNGYTSSLASGALISGSISQFIIQGTPIISTTGTAEFMDITKGVNIVPTVTINNARIQNFSSLGSIVGGNLFAENIGFILNDDGYTLTDMTIVQIAEANFIFQSGDHLSFEGTLGVATFDRLVAAPASGDSLFNFAGDLVIAQKVTITNTLFSDAAGGTMFKAGGLDQTNPGIVAFNNGNALDSYWVGSTGFTGGTTETVFSDTVTWVKIAGTYQDGYSERTSHIDGVSTYFGNEKIFTDLVGSAKVLMTPETETDIIQVALFKNNTEVPNSRVQHSLDAVFGTPTSPDFNPRENVLLEKNNTYELRARNISNPTNVIFTDAKTTQRK